MFRRISIAAIIVLLVATLAPLVPAAAQSDTPTPTPGMAPTPLPACTTDEDVKIIMAMKDFGDQYTAAGKNAADAKTADDFIALAVAFNQASIYFNTDTFPQFPQCADAYVLTVVTQFMLNNSILSETSAAAALIAQAANNADQATAFSDAAKFHAGKLTDYAKQFGDDLTAIATAPLLAEWPPACTPEQLSSDTMTKIGDVQTTFGDAMPDLTTFLGDGKFNFDLLNTLETKVLMPWEPLSDAVPVCSEALTGATAQGTLYYDSVLALSFANLAEYSTAENDTETATTLVDIETSQIDTVKSEIQSVMPGETNGAVPETPTPTPAS